MGFGFGQTVLVALFLADIMSGFNMGTMMSNAGGALDNTQNNIYKREDENLKSSCSSTQTKIKFSKNPIV